MPKPAHAPRAQAFTDNRYGALPPGLDADALVEKALAALCDTLCPAGCAGEAWACALVLTTNPAIRDMNRTYRGFDKPTNVLSFENDDPFAEPGEPPYLGDIAMAVDVIVQEAEDQQKPLPHHFTHMAIHGLLHLMGFDHMTDADAVVMENLEIRILSKLDIPNPYDEV